MSATTEAVATTPAPAAAAATTVAPGQSVPFQSASLYVGDLHNEVTESLLFELFNKVGPVASIRVCRDSVTRRSLGYAYVNFHNVQDAERSLDTMNFTDIKGRPCRIMWSQRDPSLRKSGVGNVYVKSLAPSVDNKGLYDTFSVFGNILSCKVATDELGVSKGYGYVHFETAEAAQDAISKFNGTLIDDIEVSVGPFVKRGERAGQADWTNLYAKQFPTSWDEAKLSSVFEAYGAIANASVMKDVDGKSKGFGFINYADHESAVKALAELNGKSFPEEEGQEAFDLYVSRAQKKMERARENKSRLDALNQEKMSKYQGMNLYVKNIADSVTDESFREAFAVFGTITSARIMRENNEAKESKGFGFICYSSPEEATKAVTEMNGKSLGGKPLVVTMHQRKEHRRAHLAATYAPQGMRYPQGMSQGGMGMPPFMGMYMTPGQPGFPGQPSPRGMPNGPYPYGGPGGNPMGGRGGPGGNMGGRGMNGPGRPGGYYPGVPPFMQQNGPQIMPMNQYQKRMGQNGPGGNYPGSPSNMQGQRRNMPGQGGMPMNPMGGNQGNRGPNMGGPMGGNRGQMQGGVNMQMQGQPGRPNGPGMVKFNNQVRNQQGQIQGNIPQNMPQQQMQMQQQQIQQPAQQPAASSKLDFSDAALASADPLTQKNMIGEHLYPLIYQHQPEQAGKITGMLLEMDNGELLNLIESPDALMSKIDEALHVLRNHKSSSEE